MTDSSMNLEEITQAIVELNYNYGRGDIKNVTMLDDEYGVVLRKLQYGKEVRSFRVEGNTVYYAGHQRTIKKEKRSQVLTIPSGECPYCGADVEPDADECWDCETKFD